MYCNKCGNLVNEGNKFCNKCGNPINVVQNTMYGNINPQPVNRFVSNMQPSNNVNQGPVNNYNQNVQPSNNANQGPVNNYSQNVQPSNNANQGPVNNYNQNVQPAQSNSWTQPNAPVNNPFVQQSNNINPRPVNNYSQNVQPSNNVNPRPVNNYSQNVQPSNNINPQPMNNYNQNIRPNYNMNQRPINNYNMNQNNNRKMILGGLGVGAIIVIIAFIVVSMNTNNSYYFDTGNGYNNDTTGQTTSTPVRKGTYSTAIVYDNTYTGIKIESSYDAKKLIEKDSVDQKSKCPSGIKQVEDSIISKYGITAVNLCEIDVDFAKEIAKVFEKVYNEFPGARGNLTNLSIVNASMGDDYIAAFMPALGFAEYNDVYVFKTLLVLNSEYYLNEERLANGVKMSSQSGHFPKNATKYSPVAHELGHYLSFLALLKHHNFKSMLIIHNSDGYIYQEIVTDFNRGDFSLSMIKEAYEKYKKEVGTTKSLDEWRSTISAYAMAKDKYGKYIYDETIAEAFHDVYLNGNNAADASRYIVAVLKSKLN